MKLAMRARCHRWVGIKIDAGQGRHVVLIVGAQPDGQPAPCADLRVQVGQQSGAYPLTLTVGPDNQDVEFPNVAPHRWARRLTIPGRFLRVDSSPADAVWRQRFFHRKHRCLAIRPGQWPMLGKAFNQQGSGLPASRRIRRRQVCYSQTIDFDIVLPWIGGGLNDGQRWRQLPCTSRRRQAWL